MHKSSIFIKTFKCILSLFRAALIECLSKITNAGIGSLHQLSLIKLSCYQFVSLCMPLSLPVKDVLREKKLCNNTTVKESNRVRHLLSTGSTGILYISREVAVCVMRLIRLNCSFIVMANIEVCGSFF